jgi:predicted membrane protein
MKGSKSMFWSLFFIALGILLLIQQVLHVNLPLIRIFFGLFVVYLGLKILFGAFGIEINRGRVNKVSTSTEFVFANGDFKVYEENKVNKKFSTVFGNSNLDLSDLSKMTNEDTVKIENVFGKTKIKIAPDCGVKIKADIAFGNIKVRGQKLGSFGEIDFATPNFNSAAKKLNLDIDTVFGEVEIE